MNTKRYLLAYCTGFDKFFPLAVQIFHYTHTGRCWLSLKKPKIHDYLQISQISLCAINTSNADSELMKRFFGKFKNFLAPGFRVRKSRILLDKKQFWKIVVILTIFGKSTIFQSPLKSVDEGWHRRYKISDLRNHSIITTQNIMWKFHGIRLMLKNSWGEKTSMISLPPPASKPDDIRR